MASTHLQSGWRETTLASAMELVGGGTPKTTVPEYWNGDIPWLSVVDFNDENRWVNHTEKTITQLGVENSSTKILDKGDLIISARGTVGALAQLKRPMAFNQSCYGIKSTDQSNIDFLYYLLKYSIGQLTKNAHGSVFSTITRQTFEKIDVLLPAVPEQRAIAAVLSSLDNKIELLRNQNKTLEAIAQQLFHEWFVEFNFPNADGKPYRKSGGKMVDGELGEMPEAWRVGKVGEVIELFDSQRVPLASDVRAKRKGMYPYYGATTIMDYIDDYLFNGIYLLLAEDGSVQDDHGYPVLQYVWGQFWVNNHAHILKGINGWSSEILYLLFKKTPVASIVTGAVQPKINQKNLTELEIIIPTPEVLAKFDMFIQAIFDKTRNNSDHIKTLSTLRDSSLPRMMSGEVRVKETVFNQKV